MVNVQSIPSPAIHTEERAHEADHPSSQVALFGADQPLKLDCGIDLSPFQIAYQTYGELNAGPLQRDSDLPCADRRSARRQHPPGDRQARLVGNHGRSRPAARYRQVFHHLLERDRRLHGLDRAGIDQSRHRQIVGAGFSDHHHSRHGARADHADRPARASRRCSAWSAARWAACRRCNGPRPIRSACSRRWRSPAARGIRRRTSRSTNSAGRR